MSVERSTPLPAGTMRLIQEKAKYLAATYRFTADDYDDLEQDIALEVLRRRTEITEEKGRDEKALKTLVYHAISDLVKHRSAAMRDYRRETRLQDCQILDENNQWIPPIDILADAGRENSKAMIDLRLDLKAVIARLPRRMRPICRNFLLGLNISEIARLVNQPRPRVYAAIDDIRKRFYKAGLKEYLDIRSDSSLRFSVMDMGRTAQRLPGEKRS